MPLILFGDTGKMLQGGPGLTDEQMFGAAPAASRGLSDAEMFGQPAAAPQPQPVAAPSAPAGPTLAQRVFGNTGEGARNTIIGAAAQWLDSVLFGGVQKNLEEWGYKDTAADYQRQVEAKRAAPTAYEAMPSFTEQPTLGGKIAHGGAALTGQVLGSLFSPESFVSLGGKALAGLEKAAAPVVSKVVPKVAAPAASRIAARGAEQAAINTAIDPAIQGIQLAAAEREAYDPVQTALAPALGFVIGGTLATPGELAGAFRSWRQARTVTPPMGHAPDLDAAPTPQEIDDFAGSPEMAAFLRANGVTDPADPRIIQLQDRLTARRGAEAQRARMPLQDAGGAKLSAFTKEQARLAQEREAVELGDTDPSAASTAGRAPRQDIPETVYVSPEGQADVGDLGVRAGMDAAGRVKEGVDTQARGAFALVERQRQRAGAEIRDTQPAGRPQGADQQSVVLDDGFPVQVQGRTIRDVGGKQVEMATVQRYDPRTGQPDPEAMPYEVPVRQLKAGNYAVDPRQAQEFERRAEGPRPLEQPRMPDQPTSLEPAQTYRATPADANQDFPGATRPGPADGDPPPGRSPLPRQPEGPHPGPQRPRGEEEVLREFQQRQERERFKDYAGPGQGGAKARDYRAGDDDGSPMAGPQDAEGRFGVDDRGYVASDKGGPVRFADQKQAAKWIVNVGHKKSPDQIFEIENHPGGKGFTVRERGRGTPDPEPPRPDGSSPGGKGGAKAAADVSPGVLPPPKPRRAEDGPNTPTTDQVAGAEGDVAMARTPAPKGPRRETLTEAIRRLGGMKDDRGDVTQIVGAGNRNLKRGGYSPQGKSPDRIREALQEEGWFGRRMDGAQETGTQPGDDIRDLYDLMDREARGEKVYHPDDTKTDAELGADARTILDEELNRAGVTDDDPPDVAARKLAEFRASQEHDFLVAETERKIDEELAGLSPADREILDEQGWETGDGPEEVGGAGGREDRSSDLPGWEDDAGQGDRAAGGADKGAGESRRAPEQTRVEGTEHEASASELRQREAARDAEERQANPRAYSGKQQKPADEGLFADNSEKTQSDMFDESSDLERGDIERAGATAPDGTTTQNLLRTGTKEQILDHIARYSDDPKRASLAKVLKQTVASDINYRHMRDREIYNENGNPRGGFYDHQRSIFTVHADVAEDPERAFLHEAVHAATVSAIYARTESGKAINRLYDAYMATSGKYTYKDWGDQYGFRNSKEFIAEALTKPRFRKILDQIKADGPQEKSLWQKLADVLRRMFGLKPYDPMEYILQNEARVFDPKTILGGAARETLTVGKGAEKRPYEPRFQDEAANNLRNKFSANPIGDPELWRDVGRTLSRSFGWAKDEADAWARHVESIAGAIPKKGEKRQGAAAAVGHALQLAFYSNDGMLRSMAAKHKSQTIKDIANMFYAAPRGGRDGAVGQTYFEAQNERIGQWGNRLDDLLQPFQKMSESQRSEAMQQIGRLVTNPGAIRPGTPVHDAAAGIGKMLKDVLAYMREAGVDIGEVKRGYLPRIENVEAIMSRPEAFKKAATRAFVADGVPAAEARKSAEEWFERVLLGDQGIHGGGNDFLEGASGGGNTPDFARGRVLSKKADEILGDFYLRNPADIMPNYVFKAVRKAEWARRFGKRDPRARVPAGVSKAEYLADPLGRWKDMKQRMLEEGAGEAIPEVVDIIKSITGNFGKAATGGKRSFISLARTWSAFSYLSRATFSSLSEPVSVGIRTGNLMDALRAYGNTVRHWVPALRKLGDGKYLEELAEDMGLIGDAIDNLVMLQRVGNDDSSLLARRLQTNFFRHIGLTQFTEANRVAALKGGMVFLRRLSKDIAGKGHFSRMAGDMLNELGIKDHAAFAKWVLERDAKPHLDDILEGGDMGRAYQTALGRFVSQTVMAPTGALRPRYAQHPLGSLFYNLMSFIYAFQKNVLNRVGAMTKEAVDPRSGLTAAERAKYLAPMAMLVPLVAVQYALGEIRNVIFPDPARAGQQPQSTWTKMMTATSRAGLTGISDPVLNAFTSLRYQRDPAIALAGPIYGTPLQVAGDVGNFVGDRNSPNTNTVERKMARDVYDLVLKPTMIAGVTAAAPATRPLGLALGSAGIFGAAHPAAREAFVGSVAGPPVPRR